jgi:hypothetical protein
MARDQRQNMRLIHKKQGKRERRRERLKNQETRYMRDKSQGTRDKETRRETRKRDEKPMNLCTMYIYM